jgi:glycosyltransferase involved in cell wall biosynthesis
VLEASPHAVLDVVGRHPSASLRRRLEAACQVELFADVPDVAPFLTRAHVAVNPVVSGSGVNIKLVEYLHAGLPLVSTSLATRGLPLTPGVDLEVDDDPRGFAAAVVRLIQNPIAAERMALAGRQHLRDLLDVRTNLARIGELLSPRRSASPTG